MIVGLSSFFVFCTLSTIPQALAKDENNIPKSNISIESANNSANNSANSAKVLGNLLTLSEDDFNVHITETIEEVINQQVVSDVKKDYRKKVKKEKERAKQEAEATLVAQSYWQQTQTTVNQNGITVAPISTNTFVSPKGTNVGAKIANYACSFVGKLPYVWAGASLTTGADCCGFTMALYNAFGYNIARTVEGQAVQGKSVSIHNALPGDIVIYSGHVGLYIGNGQIVHAPTPGQYVSIANINMMPVLDIRHFVD